MTHGPYPAKDVNVSRYETYVLILGIFRIFAFDGDAGLYPKKARGAREARVHALFSGSKGRAAAEGIWHGWAAKT